MEKSETPATYHLAISQAVRQRLTELAREAAARGDGLAFNAALKQFLSRLAVYPQFGDPQIDLVVGEGQIRTGIIRPLSIRYGVNEEKRIVFCATLPVLLPMDRPKTETGE
ncbi:MAG TPA: hypothetical protein VN688_02580 [Gemmataceae bacterium]|nr:hypothetical protein [Gemmataceae bacterium]